MSITAPGPFVPTDANDRGNAQVANLGTPVEEQKPSMFTFQGPTTTNMLSKDEELRADLIWGPSKSGKTTQLVAAVDWVVRNMGKMALLITRDGGSLGELKPYSDLGLLLILPLIRFQRPLEVMDNVTREMWPVRQRDGQFTFASAEAKKGKDWFERVGLTMTESISSIGEGFQSWMAESPDCQMPQTPDRTKYYLKDGTSWRGLSAPSHVGEIHRLLFEWVHNSSSQRYARNIWTAREQRAEGTKGGLIIGPDAPGNKLTKKIGGWFGGCYHTEAVPTGVVIKDDRIDKASGLTGSPLAQAQEYEYRMYIVPHADAASGIMCDAGNRLPAGCREVSEKPYIVCNVKRNVQGEVISRPGIQTLWDLEKKYNSQTVESLKQDSAIIATMKKLGLMKDVTEV